jgi:hypothetical protein
MADQLYLSYWLRGFTEHNMLRHFSTMLSKFPFSRLSPAAVLRVRAVDETEPVLFESGFEEPQSGEIIAASKEFVHPDSAFEVSAKWDIWQFDQDWRVTPSRVSLWCLAPGFSSDRGENLRIDFGIDANFLPQPGAGDSFAPVQSNIRSLLHLVHEMDDALSVERRQLWTESGENFAEKLQDALQTPGSH